MPFLKEMTIELNPCAIRDFNAAKNINFKKKYQDLIGGTDLYKIGTIKLSNDTKKIKRHETLSTKVVMAS